MKFRFFYLFLMLIVFQVMGAPTHAVERLDFDVLIARSSLENIRVFYDTQGQSPAADMRIARVDLNEDGLYEFVVLSGVCASDAFCTYDILGEPDRDIVSFGRLQARGLLVGHDYTDGMRNLLVYDNKLNDFDYALYSWHPERLEYDRVN